MYVLTGTFIFAHYSRALEDIVEYSAKIEALKLANPSVDMDYKRLINEERDYLKNRMKEPHNDQMSCRYVSALIEYRDL